MAHIECSITAYQNLDWSKIELFLAHETPVAPITPILRAQYKKSSNQEAGSSVPSASMTPPPNNP